MDPLIVTLVLCSFFFAAFLKGTVGLGFATTCLGVMASFLDLRLAISLVIIPSLISNGLVMIEAGGFLRIFRRFWLMYAAAMPGLGLGLWVLGGGDTTLPRAVLGGSMFLYGSWGLWGGTFHLQHTPISASVVGLLTGVVNGLTGSQIMPVMPYLMSLDITKDELVQAINTSFTISSLVMFVGMGKLGFLSSQVVSISAVGIVPVAVGIWCGGRIRRRLPEAVFRKAALGMIAVLGLVLAVRAFL